MAQVEVDEMFGLVCDKGAEVSSYDAVPGRASSFVELCTVRCCSGGGKEGMVVRSF